MDKAWTVLEELGAVDEDGKLTALGRHIVRERQGRFRLEPLVQTKPNFGDSRLNRLSSIFFQKGTGSSLKLSNPALLCLTIPSSRCFPWIFGWPR